jgi:hypothetical protein
MNKTLLWIGLLLFASLAQVSCKSEKKSRSAANENKLKQKPASPK